MGTTNFKVSGNIVDVVGKRIFKGNIQVENGIIIKVTEKFFIETGIEKINALIKIGNEASRKAFTKAGYIEYGLSVHNGENAYHLIKTRGKK